MLKEGFIKYFDSIKQEFQSLDEKLEHLIETIKTLELYYSGEKIIGIKREPWQRTEAIRITTEGIGVGTENNKKWNVGDDDFFCNDIYIKEINS